MEQPKFRALTIIGFGVLALIAIAGWTRSTNVTPSPNDYYQNPGTAGPSTQQPAAINSGWGSAALENAPARGSSVLYTADRPGEPAVVDPNTGRPVFAEPSERRSAAVYGTDRPVRTITRRRVETERVVTEHSPRTVVRERPFSHSAAIVGGSAAAGAAIGAVAGGGKGAAIGALSGGGAGLVYDRLTHKQVRRE